MTNISEFSQEWISAWNSHDIEKIMNHYAENIVFHSPVIKNLGYNDTGLITEKSDLQKYFEKGLAAYPDLNFELHDALAGTDSLVLYYTSINNRKSAELMQFDEEGKVNFVRAHYSN